MKARWILVRYELCANRNGDFHEWRVVGEPMETLIDAEDAVADNLSPNLYIAEIIAAVTSKIKSVKP